MTRTTRTIVGAAAALAFMAAAQAQTAPGTPPARNPRQPETRPAPAPREATPAPPAATPAPPAATPGAQPTAQQASPPAGGLTPALLQQMDEIHVRNLGHIQAGQLAASQAQSPQVKSIAQKIVTDRQQIDQKLAELARAPGHTLPGPTPAVAQAIQADVDQLRAQQGEAFDRAYVQYAIREHMEDENRFKALRDQTPGKESTTKKWLDDAENVIEADLAALRQAKVQLDAARGQARRPPGK